MTVEAAGLFLDYSKNRINDETLAHLIRLAEEVKLPEKIQAMFRGDKINATEQRAVLHIALRAPRNERIFVDGNDVVSDVHAVLDRMAAFSARVRSGEGALLVIEGQAGVGKTELLRTAGDLGDAEGLCVLRNRCLYF